MSECTFKIISSLRWSRLRILLLAIPSIIPPPFLSPPLPYSHLCSPPFRKYNRIYRQSLLDRTVFRECSTIGVLFRQSEFSNRTWTNIICNRVIIRGPMNYWKERRVSKICVGSCIIVVVAVSWLSRATQKRHVNKWILKQNSRWRVLIWSLFDCPQQQNTFTNR